MADQQQSENQSQKKPTTPPHPFFCPLSAQARIFNFLEPEDLFTLRQSSPRLFSRGFVYEYLIQRFRVAPRREVEEVLQQFGGDPVSWKHTFYLVRWRRNVASHLDRTMRPWKTMGGVDLIQGEEEEEEPAAHEDGKADGNWRVEIAAQDSEASGQNIDGSNAQPHPQVVYGRTLDSDESTPSDEIYTTLDMFQLVGKEVMDLKCPIMVGCNLSGSGHAILHARLLDNDGQEIDDWSGKKRKVRTNKWRWESQVFTPQERSVRYVEVRWEAQPRDDGQGVWFAGPAVRVMLRRANALDVLPEDPEVPKAGEVDFTADLQQVDRNEVEADFQFVVDKTKWEEDYEEYKSIMDKLARKGVAVFDMESNNQNYQYMLLYVTNHALLRFIAKRGKLLALKSDAGGGLSTFSLEKKDLFEPLTTAQRQRFIYEYLSVKEYDYGAGIGLGNLLDQKVITQAFPLHNHYNDELHNKWIKRIFMFRVGDDVRAYFGEKIAMYFAWAEFYTYFSIPTAILGTLMFLVQFVYSWIDNAGQEDSPTNGPSWDGPATPFYAMFLVVWAVLFVEMWNRRERQLAHRWGMLKFDKTEPVRKGFRFRRRKVDLDRLEFTLPIQVNAQTGMEKYYPEWKRFLTYFISLPLILGLLAVLAGTYISFFLLRRYVSNQVEDDALNTLASLGVSVLVLIVILIFGTIFHYLAHFLNNLENYRTQSEHDDRLILKIFGFEFINNYLSLYLIAFGEINNPERTANDRFFQLFLQILVILFVKQVGKAFLQIGQKYAIRRFKAWRGLDQESADITRYDRQANLPVYDEIFNEYLELVTQYGFVVLFAAAFPLGALGVIFSNVIEMRTDALKLTKNTQKPIPEGADNIGSWKVVLFAISGIAIISNSALIAFASDALYEGVLGEQSLESAGLGRDLAVRFILFVVVEHILLGVFVTARYIVPDEPVTVRKKIEREEYKKSVLFNANIQSDVTARLLGGDTGGEGDGSGGENQDGDNGGGDGTTDHSQESRQRRHRARTLLVEQAKSSSIRQSQPANAYPGSMFGGGGGGASFTGDAGGGGGGAPNVYPGGAGFGGGGAGAGAGVGGRPSFMGSGGGGGMERHSSFMGGGGGSNAYPGMVPGGFGGGNAYPGSFSAGPGPAPPPQQQPAPPPPGPGYPGGFGGGGNFGGGYYGGGAPAYDGYNYGGGGGYNYGGGGGYNF
eukprot:gb/GECH01013213.1/.p1 GENE.gb/GECH01013213.1/~~gb/GECH01013213.1/.p1  ORF type:complete len:1195 (+),score=324.88 gb/GECH01013213.1/:1-3585(+)